MTILDLELARLAQMNTHWDRAWQAAFDRDDAAFDRELAAFWKITRGRTGQAEQAPSAPGGEDK